MKNKKDMFKPYEEEREKIALKLSQDIPFIDPYYYQYKIERTIKAQTWANKVIEENKKMIDGKDWISDLLFGYSEVHING